MRRQHKHQQGFTIVELIVTVVVISIVVGITAVSYGAWRNNVATTAVKADLATAATAMKNARTFTDAYPNALPSTFKPGDEVTITLQSGDSDNFCIEGMSKVRTNIKYYVRAAGSVINAAVAGSCG